MFKKIKKFFKKTPVKVIVFDDNEEKEVSLVRNLPKNLKLRGGGVNNLLKIHKNLKARNISVYFDESCSDSLCFLDDSGDSAGLDIDVIFLPGKNNELKIGKHTGMNGTKIWLGNGSKCNIGSNCRFSYEVIIRATDGHTIVEKDTRHILNEQKHPLIIGDHCWIGLRTIINKNVQLPHDTIVGSGSVLTKKIDDPYCIIAGSPARVIKNNVKHHKETIYEFKRCHNNNPN